MDRRRMVEEQARDDDARSALTEAQETEDAVEAEDGAAGAVEAEEATGETEDGGDGTKVYRTQREIDAAMGRRLRRERDRWERKHARALMLEEALGGEGGVEEAVAAVLAQRLGLDAADVRASMEGAADPRELAASARRAALIREAEALRADDPAFDLDAAMGNTAFRALVEAGEPLGRARAYLDMDAAAERLREDARLEMLRSIRARGGRPAPMRARGGFAGADVSSMSEAALRAIDERLKRGERVRL